MLQSQQIIYSTPEFTLPGCCFLLHQVPYVLASFTVLDELILNVFASVQLGVFIMPKGVNIGKCSGFMEFLGLIKLIIPPAPASPDFFWKDSKTTVFIIPGRRLWWGRESVWWDGQSAELGPGTPRLNFLLCYEAYCVTSGYLCILSLTYLMELSRYNGLVKNHVCHLELLRIRVRQKYEYIGKCNLLETVSVVTILHFEKPLPPSHPCPVPQKIRFLALGEGKLLGKEQ